MPKRSEHVYSNIKHKKGNYVMFRNTKTQKIFKGITTDMMKKFFFLIRTYFDLFVDFIFSLYWEKKRQPIPDLEEKHGILSKSATELASKIRNKELKSEELVQACIERIKIVNPILNAVTDERFEDALVEAREVDRQIAAGEVDFEKKPFLGVPFTAKESHAVEGLLHTLGISARAQMRATEDAECVRLLRASGAIALAVTNVPEINKWQETRNMVFGQTVNPYHTGRTVGGSSGGEAALAAALASPISLCSDIGGSTRMPAFYCGLFGLNPTAGYTSLKGSALRSGKDATMASIGFISTHCCDLGPLTRTVLSDTAADLQLDREVDIKNIKFFYTERARDVRVSPVSRELRKAMNKVIRQLTEDTSPEKAPKAYYHSGFDHMYALWRYGMTKEAESFPRLLTNNQGQANGLLELVKKLIGFSAYTLAAILKLLDEQVLPPVDSGWAEKITKDLRDDLIRVLGEEGVLLFPSAPAAAPYHYALYLRPFNFSYWGLFNALKFPAAQVPLGLNKEGLPLGLQVVAAPGQEALCLAVARHLEDRFGGYVPPCKLPQ
ncbi:fatty-acid amide hydrolase 2-like [Battus philenor]|uniref:fatty-acid amide hydrolase 2-like n=1 Tax=Battus philenor TaxID=42288 RepID=UPI0035CFB753